MLSVSVVRSDISFSFPFIFIFRFLADRKEKQNFAQYSISLHYLSLSLKMEEEEIDFKVEAEMVIDDIGFTVESISISKELPSSRECVYLNVLTKERNSICVELSVLGFRVSTLFISFICNA